MEVLARVERRLLPGGEVTLTAEQESRTRDLGWLPTEVEQRLGADRNRNAGILRTILDLDPSWKTVVFATSVTHARELAALLNFRGVRAAAIWSDTDAAARRHYVRDFNEGSLQVLTNYGVLAEGFDAPSTRVVIVARPTLSPVRYQQMIGRGLRGPRNGGKAECLIVDVEDNIERLERDLAFRQFRHLFEP
jgi:superfamily II DNA or RNA helicase